MRSAARRKCTRLVSDKVASHSAMRVFPGRIILLLPTIAVVLSPDPRACPLRRPLRCTLFPLPGCESRFQVLSTARGLLFLPVWIQAALIIAAGIPACMHRVPCARKHESSECAGGD